MATQPTNVIDKRKLEDLRRELEGDRSIQIPDVVQDAVTAAAEPLREVFVGVPELKTFLVGYLFGAGTLALAILITLAHH